MTAFENELNLCNKYFQLWQKARQSITYNVSFTSVNPDQMKKYLKNFLAAIKIEQNNGVERGYSINNN